MDADNPRQLFDQLHSAVVENGDIQQSIDTSDYRGRFLVYSEALRNSDLVDLLVEAVALEEDSSLQHAMFVLLLERVPHAKHPEILAVAPESTFLVKRSDEVGILDQLDNASLSTDWDRDPLLSGTDWLQRRAAESCTSRLALEALASDGRTKKVRLTAAQTLEAQRQRTEMDLIETSLSTEVLEEIATTGSTRKIRNSASRKLAAIDQST